MVGKTLRARISRVEDVEFEQGLKPVLSFDGQDKSLVVNSTNFDVLADGISNNTQSWAGHTVLLKGEKVRFKGRLVDSIRVSVPKQARKSQPEPEPDDEIPSFDP
jgi:hypothetical protein